MGKKKRSIFQLFIIPLIFIILAQALLTYGMIYSSGTLNLIDDYSVGALRQTVKNRKITLENSMVQQWSNVDEEVAVLNNQMAVLLAAHGITMEEFISDPECQREFLEKTLSSCLYMMRKNGVNGSFIMLADGQTGKEAASLEGIYFRDLDPLVNPGDYSDVLMERGNAAITHEANIPLDTLWKSKFFLSAPGENEADAFFYAPYQAALAQPEIGYSNLAYWCKPFCLEDNRAEDSYRMFTYSVPLIHEGKVYGVMGVDISTDYFAKYLPAEELDSKEENGYLMLLKTPQDGLVPVSGDGTADAHSLESLGAITFEKTKYRGLYQIKGETVSGKKLYAAVEPFLLYDSNTPFSDNEWMIAGFRSEESLFGVRDKIMRHMVLALFIALLFGLFGTYMAVRFVTGPIKKLADCIRKSSEDEFRGFEPTGIQEVDGLAEVVGNLTDEQKLSENRLIEEKERYRLALESSSDIMFTFDLATGAADVLDFGLESGASKSFLMEGEAGRDAEEQLVHPDDFATVKYLFEHIRDKATTEFRVRRNLEAEEYQWMEMSCKAIYDTENRRSKVIGRIKNINEEKLQEQRRQEARRHDSTTGLYSRNAGMERIRTQINRGISGVLILMDVDRFRELNERFGMVFGDALMEEIGRIILSQRKDFSTETEDMVALRAGGDEFLVWLPHADEARYCTFIRTLRKTLSMAYNGESPQLQLSYGVSISRAGDLDLETLFLQAGCALTCTKRQGRGGHAILYDEMTEQQKQEAEGAVSINEIASLAYSDKLNMVSQVFNFFDKSNDIHAIIPVLLVKLGNFYQASDILVIQADTEFHTTYAAYQWHEDKTAPEEKGIHRFAQRKYRSLALSVQDGRMTFDRTGALTGEQRYFLFVPEDRDGICVTMLDKGEFMGAMIYLVRPGAPLWQGAARNDLVEITKLIETNINNQRYDLASKAKSDFLSRMSHEIRTPMNAIIGMTEIALQKKQNPAEVEDCLEKIDQSSKYLLSLINDILDMSKIESGKMSLEIRDFNLCEMLDSIDSIIRPQAESKGIRFSRETEIGEEWLKGDSLHLNQVLINLLGNAMKFTPEGQEVVLTVREHRHENTVNLFFSVRDTGIGIKEEDRLRIFNSFEQAGGQVHAQYGGTGLGLTISSRFVRMMGGEIEVESEAGKGSKFYFDVELQVGEAVATKKEKMNAVENISFDGKQVLLVEDNVLNTEIARTLLAMHGAKVECVVNGQDAVNAFCGHEPGYYRLILMDVQMPVMDGLEATRRIRQSGRADSLTVPIVAMSANAFDEDMRKSIESGMDGHLAKPINVPEFLNEIERKIL